MRRDTSVLDTRPGSRRLAAMALVIGMGAVPEAAADTAGQQAFDHEHAAWTDLLRDHVRDGLVDYPGLGAQRASALDPYLNRLSSVTAAEYGAWTREEQLAYWINVYNAFTVGFVLDHYPLRSIRAVGLIPGSAFRKSFIRLHARGRKLSLNDVEHEILRREFGEPRIHFAIVCASRSCPVLRDEAYRARDLDAQLDAAARDFVRDPRRNRFDAASRTFHASAIFKWFGEDFERGGGVPAFLARYADGEAAAALRSGGVRIDHLDYDWSLNEG